MTFLSSLDSYYSCEWGLVPTRVPTDRVPAPGHESSPGTTSGTLPLPPWSQNKTHL